MSERVRQTQRGEEACEDFACAWGPPLPKPSLIVPFVSQGPQKAVTAAAISTTSASEMFFVGSADGRLLSYDSTGTASPLAGQGHTNFVSGLASTPDGKVFSTGYDDRIREVEGSQFTYISAFLLLITEKKRLKLNNIKINYITPGHPSFPRPLSRKP